MDNNPYGAPTGDLRGEPESPGSPGMAVAFGIGILIALPVLISFIIDILLTALHVNPRELVSEVGFVNDALTGLVAGYACARVAKRRELWCGLALLVSIVVIEILAAYMFHGGWPSGIGFSLLLAFGCTIAATLAGRWRNGALRRQDALVHVESDTAPTAGVPE